jgi:hypothetical protein
MEVPTETPLAIIESDFTRPVLYTSLTVTDQAAALNTLPGVPAFHAADTARPASL